MWHSKLCTYYYRVTYFIIYPFICNMQVLTILQQLIESHSLVARWQSLCLFEMQSYCDLEHSAARCACFDLLCAELYRQGSQAPQTPYEREEQMGCVLKLIKSIGDVKDEPLLCKIYEVLTKKAASDKLFTDESLCEIDVIDAIFPVHSSLVACVSILRLQLICLDTMMKSSRIARDVSALVTNAAQSPAVAAMLQRTASIENCASEAQVASELRVIGLNILSCIFKEVQGKLVVLAPIHSPQFIGSFLTTSLCTRQSDWSNPVVIRALLNTVSSALKVLFHDTGGGEAFVEKGKAVGETVDQDDANQQRMAQVAEATQKSQDLLKSFVMDERISGPGGVSAILTDLESTAQWLKLLAQYASLVKPGGGEFFIMQPHIMEALACTLLPCQAMISDSISDEREDCLDSVGLLLAALTSSSESNALSVFSYGDGALLDAIYRYLQVVPESRSFYDALANLAAHPLIREKAAPNRSLPNMMMQEINESSTSNHEQQQSARAAATASCTAEDEGRGAASSRMDSPTDTCRQLFLKRSLYLLKRERDSERFMVAVADVLNDHEVLDSTTCGQEITVPERCCKELIGEIDYLLWKISLPRPTTKPSAGDGGTPPGSGKIKIKGNGERRGVDSSDDDGDEEDCQNSLPSDYESEYECDSQEDSDIAVYEVLRHVRALRLFQPHMMKALVKSNRRATFSTAYKAIVFACSICDIDGQAEDITNSPSASNPVESEAGCGVTERISAVCLLMNTLRYLDSMLRQHAQIDFKGYEQTIIAQTKLCVTKLITDVTFIDRIKAIAADPGFGARMAKSGAHEGWLQSVKTAAKRILQYIEDPEATMRVERAEAAERTEKAERENNHDSDDNADDDDDGDGEEVAHRLGQILAATSQPLDVGASDDAAGPTQSEVPITSGAAPTLQWHAFLSHFQRNGGDAVQALHEELTARGVRCWYDNAAEEITAESMEAGVQGSAVFLLYLTDGVLTRPSASWRSARRWLCARRWCCCWSWTRREEAWRVCRYTKSRRPQTCSRSCSLPRLRCPRCTWGASGRRGRAWCAASQRQCAAWRALTWQKSRAAAPMLDVALGVVVRMPIVMVKVTRLERVKA